MQCRGGKIPSEFSAALYGFFIYKNLYENINLKNTHTAAILVTHSISMKTFAGLKNLVRLSLLKLASPLLNLKRNNATVHHHKRNCGTGGGEGLGASKCKKIYITKFRKAKFFFFILH